MAYGYYSKTEEHAFRTFSKDLKGDNIPGVVLLYGKEQFLVDWARKEIIDKYTEPASRVLDLTVIDEEELQGISPINAIIESCETMPLLSKKKVVIVREGKLIKTGDSKELSEYISNLPPSTCLVFLATEVDKRRTLIKGISSSGKLYDFNSLERKELISFIDKRFKAGGISLTAKTMDYLLDKTGYFNKESDYNLYYLSNDISKMIAMSNDGILTPEIVNDAVEGDMDTFIFNLLNNISENKKGNALKLLHNILGDSQDPSHIIRMIVGQFEIMYSIKQLMDNRVPDRIIVEKMEIKEARLRVLKPFIIRFTSEKLKEILASAYEMDKNIKTGLLKSDLALEYFVARI